MNGFDLFDRCYCIHLPNADRRAKIELQLRGVGLTATFVHATPPIGVFEMSNMRRNPRREFAINLSHIKAVAHALNDRAQCPLFIEDDIEFRLFPQGFHLPEQWDVLYLGGHPRDPVKPLNDWLVKVGRFSFAEAYSIRGSSLLEFHDFWLDRIGQPNAMFDFILGAYAATKNSFCVRPLVTRQAPGISQVSGNFEDKSALIEKGWAANS